MARSLFGCLLAGTVALLVLLKLDVAGRLSYAIEKGRIRAMREAMPTSEELGRSAQVARLVTRTVSPAVVSIMTERRVEPDDEGRIPEWARRFHEFLRRHADTNGLQDDERPPTASAPSDEGTITVPTGIGSGFVVDAQAGLILTNRHVVAGNDIIRVRLADGRERPAKLIGADRLTDLAVIAIEAEQLFALPLGDSEAMEVGDDVFAVGAPFGLGGSFSRGIISAKGRSDVNLQGIRYQKFIQTDAVINPGNSGGPLVNMRGEVIGINTAIATDTGSYDGVGFAIPASRVKQVLPRLLRGEPVRRGYLGIEMRDVADSTQTAGSLGWTESHGVIVWRVLPGSPAERDGRLRPKDIVIEYDGQRVTGMEDLREAVAGTPPGSSVRLGIWRGGQRLEIHFELGELPENF